jgi:hypothetical protein
MLTVTANLPTCKEPFTAHVEPGKSVRITGARKTWNQTLKQDVDVPFDLTFKVGDTAVHGAYNLVYTGTVTNIGAKTVTVKNQSTVKRMKFADFAFWNHDYDAERIAKENANTMMHI